jgi:murein DD-endopeptidase MepM/ murein hydrolase activator NlpD
MLLTCSLKIQEDINGFLSNKLENMKTIIKDKDNDMIMFRKNAAYFLALEPVYEYFSEEELFELIEEIPKGNLFTTKFQFTSSFGESTGFFPRDDHKGIDGIPKNAHLMNWDVMAFAPGKIVGFGYDKIHGKNIIQEYSDRIQFRYSHLGKIYDIATTGKTVTIKTKIGIMGKTGFSKNAHLHFEILIKVSENKWIQINPRPFIKGE